MSFDRRFQPTEPDAYLLDEAAVKEMLLPGEELRLTSEARMQTPAPSHRGCLALTDKRLLFVSLRDLKEVGGFRLVYEPSAIKTLGWKGGPGSKASKSILSFKYKEISHSFSFVNTFPMAQIAESVKDGLVAMTGELPPEQTPLKPPSSAVKLLAAGVAVVAFLWVAGWLYEKLPEGQPCTLNSTDPVCKEIQKDFIEDQLKKDNETP